MLISVQINGFLYREKKHKNNYDLKNCFQKKILTGGQEFGNKVIWYYKKNVIIKK